MNDLLTRHMLDLVDKIPPNTFVVGGGFGLNLKRSDLLRSGARTLLSELPEARVTTDIDLFLNLEVFIKPTQGRALRAALNELGYTERTPKWQFEKALDPTVPDQMFALDLLARTPGADDGVRVQSIRVGKGAGAGIHGREVTEAFAVEMNPVRVAIVTGSTVAAQVRVPHPYAWISMKVRAAHDWLRNRTEPWTLRENQARPSGKHAFDVMLLVAMLTENELDEAAELAPNFFDHPLAEEIRGEAVRLFGTETAPGWIEARRQSEWTLDHALVWETLRAVLAIEA